MKYLFVFTIAVLFILMLASCGKLKHGNDTIWAHYRVAVGTDSCYIYDIDNLLDRYVGAIPYSDSDKLSQLIREDNR